MGIISQSQSDIVSSLEQAYAAIDSCYVPNGQTAKKTAMRCVSNMIAVTAPLGYIGPYERSVLSSEQSQAIQSMNFKLLLKSK